MIFMNKKKIQVVMILLLLSILVYLILAPSNVIESVNFSISIWKDNLFPTLFPFFVVSNLLMQYGFIDIIGKFLEYPMNHLFHLPKDSGFVLAASLFSGFPSGSKYTSDLVKNKKLTPEEGARLLTFTHYSNPLFIIGMIGNILLNNKMFAYIILIAHISGGLITGYLYNHFFPFVGEEKEYKKEKTVLKPFGELLQTCIFSSLNTMFLLLGIVTIFLILNSFLQSMLNLSSLPQAILAGILEMTQGVKLISALEISELLKVIIITMILSFGGFSVHMQVLGIISDAKIKYKPFLLARVLHAILSGGFAFILYQILC